MALLCIQFDCVLVSRPFFSCLQCGLLEKKISVLKSDICLNTKYARENTEYQCVLECGCTLVLYPIINYYDFGMIYTRCLEVIITEQVEKLTATLRGIRSLTSHARSKASKLTQLIDQFESTQVSASKWWWIGQW